ncbi:hypothetical protein KRR40_25145 [Niabella defluvii]|nr:hypothetical protein KRR40_25145 [Niabella sp. I65]
MVLDTLGEGDGCETCRPAVSSVLASLWNELIVKKRALLPRIPMIAFLQIFKKEVPIQLCRVFPVEK